MKFFIRAGIRTCGWGLNSLYLHWICQWNLELLIFFLITIPSIVEPFNNCGVTSAIIIFQQHIHCSFIISVPFESASLAYILSVTLSSFILSPLPPFGKVFFKFYCCRPPRVSRSYYHIFLFGLITFWFFWVFLSFITWSSTQFQHEFACTYMNQSFEVQR